MLHPWDEAEARAIIARHRHLQGAMLPVLHALQDHFGYIDVLAKPLIADCLNVSLAEVHGVISFYHDFRKEPPKGRVVKLCRAEACQALGVEQLAASVPPEATETVYCLGNCALGPAAMVDGAVIGRMTQERLQRLLAGAEAADLQAEEA